MPEEPVAKIVSKVNALLERASLTERKFENCFAEVADLIGARSFHLAELAPSGEQRFLVHQTGRDMLRAYYDGGWHDRDVWTRRALLPSLKGNIVFDHMVMSEAEARRDPYIQDYCTPWGVRHFSAFAWRSDVQTFGFTIIRPTDNPFSSSDAEVLRLIRPAAIGAFLVASAMRDSHFRGIASGLEFAGRPSVILNQLGRISFMSKGAEALEGSVFRAAGGRIRGLEPASDAAFRRIEAYILGKSSTLPGAFRIASSYLNAPVFAFCVPLRDMASAELPGAAFLIVFADPHKHPAVRRDHLFSFWGLTPREADLAQHIASGATLEQASEELGLRLSTVRQMHKALLTKTGASGRAQLALLLSGISRGV